MNSRWKKNISMLCALTVAAVPMALNVGAGAPDTNDSGVLVNEAVQIGEAYVEGYILTIPASFNVQNEGWNEIGDISAVGYLADGKKLVVSADSANHWGMKNEASGQYVNYDLKNSAEGDFTNQWEFTELSETPATQTIGVDVEPFKGKDLPAGEYTDVLTFTASVEDIPVTGIKLDQNNLELTVGETSATLNATVSPDNAADKTVTWVSSNTDVATVENGVVTPVAYGTATITAKAGDKTANCNVKVGVPLRTAFENGAVTRVIAKSNNGSQDYIVEGTFNGSNFVNVTKSGSMTDLMKNVSMVKNEDKIVVTISTIVAPYGTINLTFDATNNTYVKESTGYVPAAPTGFGSITVNGNNVYVKQS